MSKNNECLACGKPCNGELCDDCRMDEDENDETYHGWTQDGEGCGMVP